MRTRKLLTTLLLLTVGAGMQLAAQTAVTAGSQVTAESSLVSGKAYLVYYVGNGSPGYMKDTGSAYTGLNDNNPNERAVYIFTTGSTSGTWKVQNYYTGKYWGTPTANANTYIGSDTGGDWALNFQSGNNIAPSCNGHSWNRSGSNIHPWSSGTANVNQFRIYEVALSTTALSELTDKDISVAENPTNDITTGQWYLMFDRGANHGWFMEHKDNQKLWNYKDKPSGSAAGACMYLVRLVSATGGKYYLQTGYGNYFSTLCDGNAGVSGKNNGTTALKEHAYTIAKINNSDGHFYLQDENNVIMDADDVTSNPSVGGAVAGWGTTVPTTTDGNNDWAFYPVTLVDSWVPTINEVYTISHANRGSVIYNSSASTKYVWSSGKSGTFDASNANSQWVIIPTATAKQYYLYNVGAGKFAIPLSTASEAFWVFSSDAVAVEFITQSDGTKKIKTVTSNTYLAISNGKNNPIINYNDAGGNFTFTKVDGQDQSTAATAAKNKLVDNQTAASAVPASGSDSWYIIRIKTHGTYADKYVYPAESEINYNGTYYSLTFDHGANIRPAIDDVYYYTRIVNESGTVYWQMPNGKYLYGSGNKFPISTTTKSSFSMDYTSGFRMWGSSRYAVPYLLSNQYFIGETASSGNAYYDIYPIDLTEAGLTPWQVTITNGSDGMQLTCTRSDVKGLTAVYNNGYFFLPTGQTPLDSDFSLTGMISCTVDAENHTITAVYDPELSITSDDIVVKQGNQVTGKGNTMQALLRIKATPFADIQPTQFTISLSGASNVDNVKVYSTTSDQIRFAGVTPTLLGTAASPSDGTVNITVTSSSISAGTTLYYWVTADVKSTATEWETIDASLSSISYTNSYKEANTLSDTELDLSSIGNPDGVMRIYKSQNTLWTSSKSNSQYYRIPALLKTGTNTLLAFTDDRYANHGDLGGNHKIDVLVKKSTDGGATWGNAVTVAAGDGSTAAGYGYGDAAVAQATNGDIVCLMAAGNTSYGNGMLHIGYTKSTDGGATWSAVTDLYGSANLTNNHTFQSTFVSSGHGITQTIANAGRIAFPALGKINGTTNEYVIYSDNNGATWTFTDNYGYTGADESKLLELNDGKLLMSIRTGGFNSSNVARGYNRTTDTNVENWGTQGTWSDLTANGCNSDLIYYTRSTSGGRDVMLHSVVKSYSSHRKDLRLYMSFDEGNTWKEAFQLQPGWAAYSSMQVLDNGDLAILFEDGSIGNEDANDCFDINYVTISSELLATKIEELDPMTDAVKIIYGNNAETYYGSWNEGHTTWTSNGTTNPIAGVTLTKKTTGGSFGNYNSVTGYTDLYYYFGTGTGGLTLTAPAGYIITGYSAKLRQGQNKATAITVTAEDGTSVTPVFAGAIESFTDFTVSGLHAASTDIEVVTTDNVALCFVNFVVNLQSAVEYHVVDASGNEMASHRFIPESNSVETAMPTSLKRAFCTYAYYSDATCTTTATTIDDKTDIYVLCTVNAPFEFSTVENPKWYFMYAHKQNDANDYLAYANGTAYTTEATTFFNKYSDTKYHWAFIGNPYSVQVLNRSNNGYLSLSTGIGSASNNSALTNYTAVTSDALNYPYNTFSLYGFSSSHVVTTNPFSLCLNAKAGVFVNGYNGNLYYHNAVVPNSDLQITNWKDAHVMAIEVPTTYPITLNAVGDASYATLYLPFDVTTDAATTAYYIATANNGYAQLTATGSEGTEIPARTAVVLVNSSAETNATLNVTSGLSSVVEESANLLKGTLTGIQNLDLSDETNYYSLGQKDGNIGFYKFNKNGVTSIDLGANKAYLDTTAPSGSAKGFRFTFDPTTGISTLNAQPSALNQLYDLSGRRVSKPTKGLYIVNGKKVTVQ